MSRWWEADPTRILLTVDDLDETDQNSRAALLELTARVLACHTDPGIRMVFTATEPGPGLPPGLTVREIAPWDEDQLSELVRARLGVPPAPTTAADLHRAAAGRPGSLIRLLDQARERGELRSAGPWVVLADRGTRVTPGVDAALGELTNDPARAAEIRWFAGRRPGTAPPASTDLHRIEDAVLADHAAGRWDAVLAAAVTDRRTGASRHGLCTAGEPVAAAAMVHLDRGRPVAALRWLDGYEPVARPEAPALLMDCARADLDVLRGRADDAVARLEQCADWLHDSGVDRHRTAVLDRLTGALHAAGRTDDAIATLDEWADPEDPATLRARIELGVGDPTTPVPDGPPFQVARAHLALALATGAAEHRDAARRGFSALGARLWTLRVPDERSAARRRIAADVISELIACGLGNAAVATATGLTEKQVKRAVGRLLTTTGARGRAELGPPPAPLSWPPLAAAAVTVAGAPSGRPAPTPGRTQVYVDGREPTPFALVTALLAPLGGSPLTRRAARTADPEQRRRLRLPVLDALLTRLGDEPREWSLLVDHADELDPDSAALLPVLIDHTGGGSLTGIVLAAGPDRVDRFAAEVGAPRPVAAVPPVVARTDPERFWLPGTRSTSSIDTARDRILAEDFPGALRVLAGTGPRPTVRAGLRLLIALGADARSLPADLVGPLPAADVATARTSLVFGDLVSAESVLHPTPDAPDDALATAVWGLRHSAWPTVLDAAGAVPDGYARVVAQALVGESLLRQDDLHGAAARLAELPTDLLFGHLVWWAQAGLATATGEHRRARHLLDAAERRCVDRGYRPGRELLVARRIEVELALGDRAAARAGLARLGALCAAAATPEARLIHHLHHATIEADAAVAQRAVILAGRLGNPFLQARGRQLQDAIAELQPGSSTVRRAAFDDLAARPWYTTVPDVPRPSREFDARDDELLDLLSRGATNAAAAAATGVSEKAVEARLTRLYRRTGLRSRVELLRAHQPAAPSGGGVGPLSEAGTPAARAARSGSADVNATAYSRRSGWKR